MKNRKKYPKNESGRDFVCGDLHGTFDRLTAALDFLGFDKKKDRLFSVGDLVDRGPDNEKCLALLNEPWFFAVRGNHEVMMNDYYTNGPYAYVWPNNGGQWGIGYAIENDSVSTEIKVLAQKAAELPLMITVERQDGKLFHVIHAELASEEPLTDASLDDEYTFNDITHRQTMDGDFVIWGRFIFYNIYQRDMEQPRAIQKFLKTAQLHKMDKMFSAELSHIYSGHTIVRRPTRFMGQTNLDTYAYDSIDNPAEWKGLTITEPLTDKFWLSNGDGVKEVEPLILA